MIPVALILAVVILALALIAGASKLLEREERQLVGLAFLMVVAALVLIPLLALYLNAVNPS